MMLELERELESEGLELEGLEPEELELGHYCSQHCQHKLAVVGT
jgi:hypothetical protein